MVLSKQRTLCFSGWHICFCYSRACLWNNLPQGPKSVGSIGQFKQGIKKVFEISDSHMAIM